MKHTAPRFLWIVSACLALLPQALAWSQAPESASKPDSSKPIAPAPPAARTTDWPREFKEDGSTIVLYQPQIESWENQTKLVGRTALRVTPPNSTKPYYGALRFHAETRTNINNRTVYVSDLQIVDVRFSEEDAPTDLPEIVKQLVPTVASTIALDEVLAYVDTSKPNGHEIQVSSEAPKIFYSTEPALLLITQGEPVLVDVKDTALKSLLNTNWDIFLDTKPSSYYLFDKD